MANNSRPGLSLIEDEYWYAGPISERKSEQILSERGEAGSFLVRDSFLPEADYVLSVSSGKEIWHYDVNVMPNNECVFNNYGFSSLPDAIEFYMENRLGSIYLKEPKEPVVSPADVSKPAAPVIKKIVGGTVLQPRTNNAVLSSKQTKVSKQQNTPNSIDLSKLDDHPWQGQDGSQAGYSPALSHNSNRSHSGQFSSTSIGDEVRSQGSSKSSRSQTSEVDSSYILPNNNIESVFIPANDVDKSTTTSNRTEMKAQEGHSDVEVCETNFINSDDIDKTDTTTEEPTVSKNGQNPQLKIPIAPEVVKSTNPSEKTDELKQLPSISDKMLELEKRSRGESATTKKGRPKSPLPPAVPKRVSSITNMQTSKPHETETESEKPSAKTTAPPPSPKRLSIPEMFLEKSAEEQNSLAPPKSPSAQTKRIEIPNSLELMPPPPPLSTHPGLASKMKEEEDKDKLQPQMGKKRKSGLMNIKKRNSKREKEKRKSLPEEPTLLGSEEKNRNSSPTQQDQSASAPKRLSGVPTPALSPGAVGGDDAELESKFKSITKQNWNPENFETNPAIGGSTIDHDVNTSAQTFGHPSPSPRKQSGQRSPSVTSEPNPSAPVTPKSVTSPVTQEVVKNSDDIDGTHNESLEGVSTFLPNEKTRPVGSETQKERDHNPAAVTTAAAANSSSDRPKITENGIPVENGLTDTQPNTKTNTVPTGVKQMGPTNKSPARSPKHQMPPGFMLVGPSQPLPQQFTKQRRFTPTMATTYDNEQSTSKKSTHVQKPTTPGPMNTKRVGGGSKKRKSFIFKK